MTSDPLSSILSRSGLPPIMEINQERKNMRRLLLFAAAVVLPTASLSAQSGTIEAAVNSITPEDIDRRIGIIAHDSMQGRNTPSPELNQTADWIAETFRSVGLAPGAGDGTFIQRYTLRWVRLNQVTSSIAVAGGPTWRFGPHAIRLLGNGTGPEGVSGPTVVLFGTPLGPEPLAGIPLTGATVILAAPNFGVANQLLDGIVAQEPAAIILLSNTKMRPESSWSRGVRALENVVLVKGWAEGEEPNVIELRDETAAPVLGAHGLDLAALRRRDGDPFTAQQIDGLDITLTIDNSTVEELTAPNVVGVLEGSDPVLKHEYVIFSAHMDHVGVEEGRSGDNIFNGADDDASGTVAVVELAEAFAKLEPRPRRSLLFLTVSGEERGLWGSEYFATNSPVDISQLVANLNADMLGRNWKDSIVVIGKEHSDLGATLHSVAAAHPELGMTPIGDLWPEERFYYRSDHFNFARKGVPILFFFNGTHEDYHQPGDEPDKIDAEKESRIVRLMFYLALEIANRDERPQWHPESYEQIVENVDPGI